jgi:hypothetical protein
MRWHLSRRARLWLAITPTAMHRRCRRKHLIRQPSAATFSRWRRLGAQQTARLCDVFPKGKASVLPFFACRLKIFKKLLTIALWRAILKRSKPLKRRYADNAPTESPKCWDRAGNSLRMGRWGRPESFLELVRLFQFCVDLPASCVHRCFEPVGCDAWPA